MHGLVCEHKAPGFWIQTGGSTGTPTPVYKDHGAHGWALATQYYHRHRLGAGIFSPMGMLWGHSVSFAPGAKGWLKKIALPLEDWLRNRLRLSAYDLSPASLDQYLIRLRRFRPVLLYGYATAVYLLADAVERTGGQWPELKAIVTTSEVLPETMRYRIGAAFGVVPCEEYGAIECGDIATSMPGKGLEIEEHNVFLETVPNDHGSYDILVTSLWNQTMPFLRYRIGDCCGQPVEGVPVGYRSLGRVIGRANDNLVGGDGRVVHSEAVPHILKYYERCIRRFTAVQAEDGAITVHVEPLAGQTVPVADLERRFSDLLRRPVTIRLSDRLPTGSAAGKHRWVVSHFKARTERPVSAHDRTADS
jgi:phenylacetate-CoA ligase